MAKGEDEVVVVVEVAVLAGVGSVTVRWWLRCGGCLPPDLLGVTEILSPCLVPPVKLTISQLCFREQARSSFCPILLHVSKLSVNFFDCIHVIFH